MASEDINNVKKKKKKSKHSKKKKNQSSPPGERNNVKRIKLNDEADDDDNVDKNSETFDNKTSPKKLHAIKVSYITGKVTKDHILEIFQQFGSIENIKLTPPTTSSSSQVSSSSSQPSSSSSSSQPSSSLSSSSFCEAILYYKTKSDAKKAVKYMNGGMIDKQEIGCHMID